MAHTALEPVYFHLSSLAHFIFLSATTRQGTPRTAAEVFNTSSQVTISIPAPSSTPGARHRGCEELIFWKKSTFAPVVHSEFFSFSLFRKRVRFCLVDGEAKFWLEPEIELAQNYRLSRLQLKQIEMIIEEPTPGHFYRLNTDGEKPGVFS